MLVIPAEIILRPSAQGLQGGSIRYIQFLCNTFENIYAFPSSSTTIFIIPNGSTENFIDRIIYLGRGSDRDRIYNHFNIIEKSQFRGIGEHN